MPQLSQAELKALEALQRQDTKCPQFWESTYRISGSYISWRELRVFYVTMRAGEFMKMNPGYEDDTVVKTLASAGRMADANGFPFYVVSQSLLSALAETDMDEELNIEEDCPLPFDSFTFLFPRGTMPLKGEQADEVIDCLGLHVCVLRNKGMKDGGPRRDLVCAHILDEQGFCGMATFSLDKGRLSSALPKEAPEYDENRTAAVTMITMLMKLLAAMAAEPQLIDAPVVESVRPAKKQRRPLTFLTPRYLGLKFRWDHGPDWQKQSTHQQVRPHMRRGHIRRQQIGSRSVPRELRQHKLVMIKPKMVGLKISAQAAAPPGEESSD